MNRRFEFDRYVNGCLMAEGVAVEREETLPDAMRVAARLAARGANGEVPVLVLRQAPAQKWQDISTAPKDTPVLGMNKHSDIGHTHWLEADEGAEACWWNDQDDDEWHPLWWMPCLPPMPDTLIAEERGTK